MRGLSRERLPRGGEAEAEGGAVPGRTGLSRHAAVAVALARVVGPAVLLVAQPRHRHVAAVGVALLPPAREHVCRAPPPAAQLAHLIVSSGLSG